MYIYIIFNFIRQPPFKFGADWFNKILRERYDAAWEQKNSDEARLREAMLQMHTVAKGRGRGRGKARNETLDIELV